VLVGWIGRALVGRSVGMVGALLGAAYLPFIWFATDFTTEDVASLCLIVMVALLVQARRVDRPELWAAAGLMLAISNYVRPEFLVLAVPIAGVLLLGRSANWL